MEDFEPEVKIDHHYLKLMKKFSREHNIIPKNKTIKDKAKYTRKEKYRKDLLTKYFEEFETNG